jgi:hypothetical protein
LNKDLDLNLSLHQKQAEAFDSPATEILYGGAVGGGKSYLMRVAAISWAIEIPGINIYLFRRTFDELKKSHMEGPAGFRALLNKWVKAKLVDIVEHEVRFWNGSKIFLSHLQLESSLANYLSVEMHVLMIDEASSFSEKMYKILRSRVRMSGLDIPAKYQGRFPRILLSSNPGGIGHQWLKGGFVDGVDPGQIRQMDPVEGGFRRQFIPAKLEDNPTLMKESPNYADSLLGLGSDELVNAMRFGDWNVVAGAFFPEFSEKTHVIRPFAIPAHWTKVLAGDTGFSSPFAYLWFAVCSEDCDTPDGTFIPKGAMVCYREYYGLAKKEGKWQYNVGVRLTPKEVAIEIGKLEGSSRIDDRVLDPSAFAHKSGPSEAEMMAEQGIRFRRADNTRIARDGARGGWMELRQRLRGFNDVPMIYFFDTCEHTIRTFPIQQHDSNNPEDMVTDGEDHLMDAVRYACMSRPWTAPAPKPREPRVRQPTLDSWSREIERDQEKARFYKKI